MQKWNPHYSTAPVIGSAINTSSLTLTKTTEYSGDMIFENGTLKTILIDGGYIRDGVYYFYVTGHLGNNYMVVNQNGEVVQKNQYYPGGMSFADDFNQGTQQHKYNGKELDQMHGLNLYDYLGRFYDPTIWRLPTLDPLAEMYYSISPYVYCANNPMRFIDPDGQRIIDWSEWKTEIIDGRRTWVGFHDNVSLKQFNRGFFTLCYQNKIFGKIAVQLLFSYNTYSIYQYAKFDWIASGKYHSNKRRIEFFEYDPINQGTIFEEFFHAGQHDYYGDKYYNAKSDLSIEFEAKVATIYAADQSNNRELSKGDAVLNEISDSDRNIIVNSLKGEKVNTSELNKAYEKLQQSIIKHYKKIDPESNLDFSKALEYLNTLIK